MELRTISGVPIVSTGTYALDSGETTFTEADLADAVRASTDSTIVAPRLKLGHDSKLNEILGDGEPAFGQVKNLRLDANGQTVIGDYVNVPDWLADKMPAHYPGRSIEGGFDVTAPSGNEYKLVISDVALLGTEWPGITSLDDLAEVLGANGPIVEPKKTEAGTYAMAGGVKAQRLVTAKVGKAQPIAAGVEVNTFRRIFSKDLRAGKVPKLVGAGEQPKWWPRSVEAGDDGKLNFVIDDEAGHLIELPIEVDGEALKYGTPQLRTVAASGGLGPRVLASWPSSTGESPSNTEEQSGMKRDEMLKRLGLPEDADDEAMFKALAEKPDALKAETPGDGDGDGDGDGSGEGSGDGDGDDASTAATVTEGAELVTASGKRIKLAEGMVIVDKDTFETVKAGSKAGLDIQAKLLKDERDSTISAAIEKGKFAVGRREHYEKAWEGDPEGTKELIASLAPGLVPVSEIGVSGNGDAQPGEESKAVEAFESHYFPELQTASAADGGAS